MSSVEASAHPVLLLRRAEAFVSRHRQPHPCPPVTDGISRDAPAGTRGALRTWRCIRGSGSDGWTVVDASREWKFLRCPAGRRRRCQRLLRRVTCLTTFAASTSSAAAPCEHSDADRAAAERRIVDDDPWCRTCGAECVSRETVVREPAHEPFGLRLTDLRGGCAAIGGDLSVGRLGDMTPRRPLRSRLHAADSRKATGMAGRSRRVLDDRVHRAQDRRGGGALRHRDSHGSRPCYSPRRRHAGSVPTARPVGNHGAPEHEKSDPFHGVHCTVRNGVGLLTDKQRARPMAVFVTEEHVDVQTTWGINQRTAAASYREPDKVKAGPRMWGVIDSVSSSDPGALIEIRRLSRSLDLRAVDVVASLDRPRTKSKTTEAIRGWLERLRRSA